MKNKALLFILFSIPLFSFSQKQGNKFISDIFDLTGPVGWEMIADDKSWMPVRFLSPKETPNDPVREAISVTLMNKGETWNYVLTEFPKQLTGFEIIKSGKDTINNYPALLIEYKFNNKGIEMTGKVYYFENSTVNSIMINFSGIPESYQKFLPAFHKSLNTLVIYK